MSRLDKTCCEDCAKCVLLAEGQVEMFPCILDQIFVRIRRNERQTADIINRLEAMAAQTSAVPALAQMDEE